MVDGVGALDEVDGQHDVQGYLEIKGILLLFWVIGLR